MRRALHNARLLTPAGLLDGHALLLDGARIAAILPDDDARLAGVVREDLGGGLITPGFIDVQVNGGGDVLFNEAPTLESIRRIGAAHARFGTTGFLPTLISDERAAIARAIAATQQAIDAGVPGVLGVHIEGPCLNVSRRGTHDPARFRDLDEADITLLSSLRDGRVLLTLAPEMTTSTTIRRLQQAGVIVCAGHTDASSAQMRQALRDGVCGVTHLFNAMSPLTSREPGVVGVALDDADCWCGIIVDGVHVDPAVLRIALRAKSHRRFLLVSDAMPCVGSGKDGFWLQGRWISVRDGRCVDADGVISGSALDMASAVRNAVHLLGLPLDEAVAMASAQPAQFLGLAGETGRLAAGARADLVLLDAQLQVRRCWIGGVEQPAATG